jgi:broad specificity phosphatase PhoE
MVRAMPESCFWLIRHAESTWNAAGRWQGQADPPLSARGRQQARRLAEQLAGQGLEVLVASDLMRTSETAAILGRGLGLAPRLESRLREIDAGSWSGLPRAEIARRHGPALAHFDSGDPEAPAGGAECRRAAAARARLALGQLAAEHVGRRLAIVTHSGVIEALLPGLRVAHAAWTVAPAERLLPAQEGAG